VDSFAILQGWVESGPACVGFQVTTGAKHDVNGPGLKRVLDKTTALAGKAGVQLPLVMVFVTTTTGIFKRQRIVKGTKGDKDEEDVAAEEYTGLGQQVQQRAIKLGDAFEDLAKRFALGG
jgi:hypothetical protein